MTLVTNFLKLSFLYLLDMLTFVHCTYFSQKKRLNVWIALHRLTVTPLVSVVRSSIQYISIPVEHLSTWDYMTMFVGFARVHQVWMNIPDDFWRSASLQESLFCLWTIFDHSLILSYCVANIRKVPYVTSKRSRPSSSRPGLVSSTNAIPIRFSYKSLQVGQLFAHYNVVILSSRFLFIACPFSLFSCCLYDCSCSCCCCLFLRFSFYLPPEEENRNHP